MDLKERITKAKITLLTKSAWLGQLSCYLIPVPSEKVPTAGVNQKGELFYNPDYIKGLNDDELAGLFAHEIYHLVFEHPSRAESISDYRIWNIASDIKVNETIGYEYKLPSGAIKVMSDECQIGNIRITNISEKITEQIYQELIKHKKELRKTMIPWDLISDGTSKKERKDWQEVWKERTASALASVARGTLPSGLERELAILQNPTLPWTQIIRARFARNCKKLDWRKPAKKWLPWYFPGLERTISLRAVVGIDTSGSISQEQLSKFLSEVMGLAQSFRMIKINLITCDAQVYQNIELRNGNFKKLKNIKMKGRGGTMFEPVFDLVKKEFKDRIDCLLYFTDLYGSFPEKKPSYPVYWITDNKDSGIPFGKRILVKAI